MEPVPFAEITTIIAKDQKEYRPLPAHIDSEGIVTCRWQLSWKERFRLLRTGILWHQIMAFHMPLQPQFFTTYKPELKE